jgi:hypothetical protein
MKHGEQIVVEDYDPDEPRVQEVDLEPSGDMEIRDDTLILDGTELERV